MVTPVSLRFLHKDFTNEERIKKDKMKNGKKALKGLSDEEKEIKKQGKITLQNKIKEENKQKRALQPKQKKDIKKEIQHEFPYIDEVSKELLEGKHIYCDPGKRSLLTMMDDDGNFLSYILSYTNKQRIRETKRLKYQALLKNYKDKLNITTIENTLSAFNSKTCNLEKFKEYTEKIKVNQELYTSYQNEKFRQYKLYAYILHKQETN